MLFRSTVGKYNTYILESASITGPWKLVAYLKDFGKEAYFVNVPSKFISADGRTLWLCYSANFAHQNKPEWIDPPGSRYAMCLQEIKLLGPSGSKPTANKEPDATRSNTRLDPSERTNSLSLPLPPR